MEVVGLWAYCRLLQSGKPRIRGWGRTEGVTRVPSAVAWVAFARLPVAGGRCVQLQGFLYSWWFGELRILGQPFARHEESFGYIHRWARYFGQFEIVSRIYVGASVAVKIITFCWWGPNLSAKGIPKRLWVTYSLQPSAVPTVVLGVDGLWAPWTTGVAGQLRRAPRVVGPPGPPSWLPVVRGRRLFFNVSFTSVVRSIFGIAHRKNIKKLKSSRKVSWIVGVESRNWRVDGSDWFILRTFICIIIKNVRRESGDKKAILQVRGRNT